MTEIKYIFRDFRGTVVKFDAKKYGYVKQLVKIYKIPKNDVRQALTKPICKFRRGEITEEIFWKEFSKKIGKKTPKECKSIFHKAGIFDGNPYKSILNLIPKLKKLGYKNIVLSDDYKPQIKNIIKLGRYKSFDDKIISCDVGLSKYDDITNGTTKIFRYALKKYGIKAKESVFIDDKQDNCIVAQKLGIKTILAQNPRQTIRDLKNLLNIH